MKFLIITYINHEEIESEYYSYEPYIREMNIWLKYVQNVEIVAPHPLRKFNDLKRNSNSGEAYHHSKLNFTSIPSFDVLSIGSILTSLFKIPWIFFQIIGSMKRTEHIHLRCPGNISFIACIAQIFFPKKSKTAKYAGNWDSNSIQPRSYRIQKWILSNTFLTRNMKVLIYGQWPNQTKNILPFFTASFSESEKMTINKDFSSPFNFIFVGSLSAGKRPLFAIKIIEGLREKGVPAKLEIYGEGLLKNELEEYIKTNNLDTFVSLMGNYKLVELKEVYKASHFLILTSQSEGWPKAVAEAMFFGCIPITTAVSCVPWMLGAHFTNEGKSLEIKLGKRGVLCSSLDGKIKEEKWIEETTCKIFELLNSPKKMNMMSLAGQQWSQKYTLERFEVAIKDILGLKV